MLFRLRISAAPPLPTLGRPREPFMPRVGVCSQETLSLGLVFAASSLQARSDDRRTRHGFRPLRGPAVSGRRRSVGTVWSGDRPLPRLSLFGPPLRTSLLLLFSSAPSGIGRTGGPEFPVNRVARGGAAQPGTDGDFGTGVQSGTVGEFGAAVHPGTGHVGIAGVAVGVMFALTRVMGLLAGGGSHKQMPVVSPTFFCPRCLVSAAPDRGGCLGTWSLSLLQSKRRCRIPLRS